MINIKACAETLKITWVRRNLQKENKWQLLLKTLISVGENICGSEYIKCILPHLKIIFGKMSLKFSDWTFEFSLEMDFVKKAIVIKCKSFITNT